MNCIRASTNKPAIISTGMADADSGFVHTVLAITAKLADVTQAHALLHDPETVAFGDVGYQGVEKREENQNLDVDW